MTGIPVLLLEDRPAEAVWLAALARRAWPGAEVCHADCLQAALALVDARRDWAVALVDLGLPDGSGLALLHRLRAHCPQAVAVVTSIYDDDGHLFDALRAGAQGYLLKDQPEDLLLAQLQQLQAGIPPLSPALARRVLRDFGPAPAAATAGPTGCGAAAVQPVLSPRETEVLGYIGRGLRIGEAAALLGISPHTAAGYVKEIYRKLCIGSRAEAALEAARRGLT